ncbi:MAG: flippase-like domain-containing protein [Oligoflexia bacterium]|nr:flippase-like domain-containing protein [Oligoflexia bacterium]
MEKVGNKFFSFLKVAFKFFFAFAIVGYMVYSDRLDLSVVKQGLSHPYMILGGIFGIVMAAVLTIYRWGLLLRGQGIDLPFLALVRYGMIGAFFNTTMPGAVSGDLIKAWYVLSDLKGHKKTPILTAILLDRIMGVVGLIIVAVSPILWNWEHIWDQPKLGAIASLVLLLFAGVVLFFSYIMLSIWGPFAWIREKMKSIEQNKVGKIVVQAYDAWTSYRNNPWLLFKSVLLAVATHAIIVTIVILAGSTLQETNVSLSQYFLLSPIGLLTTAIPVAPAGLGVGHVAFAELFKLAGSKIGAEIFTLLVTIQIMVNLSGVFFYLKSPKIPQPNDQN